MRNGYDTPTPPDRHFTTRETLSPTKQGRYSNSIRGLLLGAAVIMLVSLPFVKEEIGLPSMLSIAAVLVLTFFAGFTTPEKRSTILLDSIVSLAGLLIFGYQSVETFAFPLTIYYVLNQVLALIFLTSFYLGTRTFRNL